MRKLSDVSTTGRGAPTGCGMRGRIRSTRVAAATALVGTGTKTGSQMLVWSTSGMRVARKSNTVGN